MPKFDIFLYMNSLNVNIFKSNQLYMKGKHKLHFLCNL